MRYTASGAYAVVGSVLRRDRVCKCDHCGSYGDDLQCRNCGAPSTPMRAIEITCCGDAEPRYVLVKEV